MGISGGGEALIPENETLGIQRSHIRQIHFVKYQGQPSDPEGLSGS